MPMTLTSMLDQAEENVREAYKLDPGANPPPFFIAFNDQDQHTVMVTPWTNERDKVMLFSVLRALFKKENVIAYTSISEAWAVKPVNGVIPEGPPSEHPGRKEVVMISVTKKGEGSAGRVLEIIRNELGQVKDLVLDTAEGDVQFGGRVTQLLEEGDDDGLFAEKIPMGNRTLH